MNYLKFIVSTLIMVFAVLLFINIDDANANIEGDCGWWAQADRYGRYECAGPEDDCYVLCPIVVTPEEN
ncbi:hypothetical protein [Gracilimonas tropica]|uniref:hypothetical protein n=1 Tax=Gracilimonas tropica TaxID=454600 RepID=UPI00037F67A7|nr:hypothetical protein [Gracilimonas tropica]